jgi:Flp pilus assembly protein TadG
MTWRLGRRGSVVVEFALVAPVMTLLAGGIYVMGSLLRANAAVNRLAMQYAISFADCSDTASGVCLTELNQYETTFALSNIAPQLLTANITLSMAQVQMSGTTPTVEYPTGLSLTAAQTSALQAAASPASISPLTYVVVTVSYVYTPLIFAPLMTPIIGSSVTLTYTAAQLK